MGAKTACILCVLVSTVTPAVAQPKLDVALPVRAGQTQVRVFVSPPADVGRLMAEIQQKTGDNNQILARETMRAVPGGGGEYTATFRVPFVVSQVVVITNQDGTLRATATVSASGPAIPVLFAPIRVGATTIRGRVPRGIPTGMTVDIQILRALAEDSAPIVVDEVQATKSDDQGGFAVTLQSPVVAGDAVTAHTTMNNESSYSVRVDVYDAADWGRTRAYFAGGVVLSKRRENASEDDNFSKQDLSLAFVLDKSWIQRQLGPLPGDSSMQAATARRPNRFARALRSARHFNTFFDTRVTALPVKVEQIATAGGTVPARGAGEFVTSKKGAVVQIGAYVPFYGGETSWRHRGSINSLFVAPIGKFGIQTITGDRATAEKIIEGRDDVFTFWSYGIGVGHYRVPNNRNVAPELVSYLHIGRGKSEAYDRFPDPNNRQIYVRGWRYFVEGRLKIPETPLQIGFDANMGEAEDDVRFVFGTRFDIGELFAKLRAF